VELTLGDAPALRILIILMGIQREKSKRLLRRFFVGESSNESEVNGNYEE
jgi:hypothetical protein